LYTRGKHTHIVSEGEEEDDDGFHVHRKMLRRRYIRKEQKEEQALRREQEKNQRRDEKLPVIPSTKDFVHTQASSSSSVEGNKHSNNVSACHSMVVMGKEVSRLAPVSSNISLSPSEHWSDRILISTATVKTTTPNVRTIIVPHYSPLRSQKFRTPLRF